MAKCLPLPNTYCKSREIHVRPILGNVKLLYRPSSFVKTTEIPGGKDLPFTIEVNAIVAAIIGALTLLIALLKPPCRETFMDMPGFFGYFCKLPWGNVYLIGIKTETFFPQSLGNIIGVEINAKVNRKLASLASNKSTNLNIYGLLKSNFKIL